MIVYMDFSGQYEGCDGAYVDCRQMPGTNCYCDDVAKDQLRQLIASYGPEGVHFFDSGNYHSAHKSLVVSDD